MSIIIALLIFSLIVIIHELGHFLLAKKSGIGVTEFSVGMGPRIISTVKGETRYSLKLLPFGGSCMMVGEDEDTAEQNSFRSKPVSARIATIAAGPVFNFILAYILAIVVLGMVGFDRPYVTYVEEGTSVHEAGLLEGDIIKEFNGRTVKISRDLSLELMVNELEEGSNTIVIERDNEEMIITFDTVASKKMMLGIQYTPSDTEVEIRRIIEGGAAEAAGLVAGDIITAINGTKIATGAELAAFMEDSQLTGEEELEVTYIHNGNEESVTLTITTMLDLGFIYNQYYEKTTPLNVLRYSFTEVRYAIGSTVESLKMLITGQYGVNDLSGPVGIVDMIGETYEASKSDGVFYVIVNMVNLALLLSANLGVMNLLPLPALDGGRLVFLTIEGIRRKPISANIEGVVHFVGLMLLMALMVYVMFNDVMKLF